MRQLGRYEIQEELGRGGFATVYKGRDTQLNRLVALKVLRSGLSNDPDFVRRFYQEAETAARFNHPNIVTIYDVGEIDSQLFISMEYIPGQNLQQWLDEKGRPLTLSEALSILQPLAAALDYAHQQGIVHRDIKPGNVMIDKTDDSLRVILTDFGLVKAMESSVAVTKTGQTLGTPEYMAPEQADPNRQHEIGPHTDRYAFGILAYRMLAGRVPFPGNSISTLNAHANLAVPSPQQFNSSLSGKVVQVLIQILSKTPANRYQTSAVFIAALKAASQLQPTLNPSILTSLGLLGIIGCVAGIGLVITLILIGPGLITDANNINNDSDMTATSQSGEIAVTINANPISSTPPPPNPTLGSTWTRPSDHMVMVYVPAGTFLMGSDPERIPLAEDDELPQHEVTLDGFWIDRTEVTNEQFVAFLIANGNQEEGGRTWLDEDGGRSPGLNDDPDAVQIVEQDGVYQVESDFGSHPVIYVTWYGAAAYCIWVGGQLPTEAQWEYAALGNDGHIYPWGNEFDGQVVNFCDTNCESVFKDEDYNDGYAYTAPVGSYPDGASWVNALDMSGNVWEWVADWYDDEYYNYSPDTNPAGPETGGFKVFRGGSWEDRVDYFLHSSDRAFGTLGAANSDKGFRCAAPGL